jgi:DNA helicase-2/ATP-dependent DNA helicase PcrA
VSSYPSLSGNGDRVPTNSESWRAIRNAGLLLLRNRHVRAAVVASYSCAFVDEYQDCSPAQHQLVRGLSEIISCRVFGDPQQAIFDFNEDGVVDWFRDVEPEFPCATELDVPFRWLSTNADLGNWLGDVRLTLKRSNELDFAGPVAWSDASSSRTAARTAAFSAIGRAQPSESVVAISKWPQGAIRFAKQMNGVFGVAEALDSDDLARVTKAIDSSTDRSRASILIKAVTRCMTAVDPSLKRMGDVLADDGREFSASAYRKFPGVVSAVEVVLQDNSGAAVAGLLAALIATESQFHRREFVNSLRRSARDWALQDAATMEEALRGVRETTRQAGRRLARFCAGTPLRVKGLEFDYAIVLQPELMSSKELYVALTRGSRALSVVGSDRRWQAPSP